MNELQNITQYILMKKQDILNAFARILVILGIKKIHQCFVKNDTTTNELKKIQQRRSELLSAESKSEEEMEELEVLSNKLEAEAAKETQGLQDELKNVGVYIYTVWDLVNTRKPYPQAIDILIDHLNEDYDEGNIEGIVRALTVKEAKGKATQALIKKYGETPKVKDNLRWVIGNAIATVMTLKDVDWIYQTVLDRSNGGSRSQLVYALGTVKTEKSEDILISLLDDPDVLPQAIAALGRLKSKKAKDKIVLLNQSKNSLIRLESKKALKKIGD